MTVTKKSRQRKHKAFRRRQGEKWCFVYILRHTLESQPFYVGQTRSHIRDRLDWHIKAIRRKELRGQSLSPAQMAIHEMLGDGLEPIIQIIDRKGIWDVTEAVWIDRFKREGVPILNVDGTVPDHRSHAP
jgi:hypothetical protein